MTRIRNLDNTLKAAIVLLILAVLTSVGGYLYTHGEINLSTIISDFYANISAELASIAITVIIIDQLNRRREQKEQAEHEQRSEQNRVKDYRKRLVREAGSYMQAFAIRAIEDLRYELWLTDDEGLLKGANLFRANLQGADLSNANLQGTVLRSSNLSEAYLFNANLRGAYLREAYLSNINWHDDKWGTATLPDETKWTPETDMRQFTNFDHPKFRVTLEKINVIRKEIGVPLIDPETGQLMR